MTLEKVCVRIFRQKTCLPRPSPLRSNEVTLRMRTASVQHRRQFMRGLVPGLVLVALKFVFFLPVDITDILYGIALLLTILITTGEVLEYRRFVVEARLLDFVAGLLFPLDCYAVLVLFGVPLTG